jgi:pyridoxal phosphate enzyme (YggS family)
MTDIERRIADNLARVREQIAAAAQRSGRAADSVTLVAVTKYVGLDEARALLAAGCYDLGESRPQDLWSKADALAGEPVRWHMIGHMQRNKVRRTLPHVSLFHSGDSQRLLAALDQTSAELSRRTPVLLEINVSGDKSKHGFAPQELEPLLPQLAELNHLEIRGLMCMAGLEGGRDQARADFSRLRELRDQLKPIAPPTISLDELSMGMSDDFDVAIEEGATLVRVGSALFEGLPEPS